MVIKILYSVTQHQDIENYRQKTCEVNDINFRKFTLQARDEPNSQADYLIN